MYFYVDTAKRKRLCWFDKMNNFIGEVSRNINKGEKCLVFCNGTIGKGRIAYNFKKDEAIRMLQGLIMELEK